MKISGQFFLSSNHVFSIGLDRAWSRLDAPGTVYSMEAYAKLLSSLLTGEGYKVQQGLAGTVFVDLDIPAGKFAERFFPSVFGLFHVVAGFLCGDGYRLELTRYQCQMRETVRESERYDFTLMSMDE